MYCDASSWSRSVNQKRAGVSWSRFQLLDRVCIEKGVAIFFGFERCV